MTMKKTINLLSLLSISLLIMGNVHAQSWTISDELKDAQLKVAFDEVNIDAGKAVYDKNCKACHKDIVAAPANDRVLPTAPNLGNQEFHNGNTDGAIFAKITYGNGAGMPPYENMISEDDRWLVIAYLRSFSDSYEPASASDAVPVAVENFEGKITKISANFDKEKNTISAILEGVDAEGNKVIPNNVKVSIFVKRNFGALPLCDGKKTDDQGMVIVDLGNVRADTSGFITLIAQTTDKTVSIEELIQINDGWKWENPLDKREMWGVRAKTPLWLLITYLSVTIGVLMVIGWAMFQLLRIYNLRER